MKQEKKNATKVAETIRVSEATTDIMQAIGRLQDAYFDVCRAFESKVFNTDDFARPWNELCNKMDEKIGGWITSTFVETEYKKI